MVTGSETAFEPPISFEDLQSGAWLTNTPEQRDAYLRLLKRGVSKVDALFASAHAEYLHHVLTFDGYLSASEFDAATQAARAIGRRVVDYLERRGYRVARDPTPSLDPVEAGRQYNARVEPYWVSWRPN